MNAFDKLRLILSQESLSKEEFELFKVEYLNNQSSLNNIGLSFLVAKIDSVIEKVEYISSEQLKSNLVLMNFINEKKETNRKPSKVYTKEKKTTNKLPEILKISKKKNKKYLKIQAVRLKKLNGNVEKTPTQLRTQALNEERKRNLKNFQTTTKNSIWTVKKK